MQKSLFYRLGLRLAATLGIVVGAAQPLLAQAQVVPDAGALTRQAEESLPPPMPLSPEPLPPAQPAPMTLPESIRLEVKSFRFAGNTLIPNAELQTAVQRWEGQTLGFAELQQATQAVATLYRQAGWIVRAYLPAQDVTDGIVTIQIVEAVFSGARVEEPASARVQAQRVLSYIDAQQAVGTPLRASALDRALLLADDLPGVTVAGALEPGARDGETALALTVRDEPLLTGIVGADNYGSRATGEARATLAAYLNSPLGLGDLLRGDVLHSKGSTYGRLAYSLPVGAQGWRVGVNASLFHYRLVADEFAALDGRGNSHSVGLEASYPLLRTRMRNLYLTFAFDSRGYDNEANQITQSHYRVNAGSVTLAGNLYDDLGGGGANQAMLSWIKGRVSQGQLDFGEDASLSGQYNKLRYSLSRRQVLTSTLALHGSFSGQYAGKRLDSSERFYLGGPYGVRAYPVSEAGGSRGNLVNLELRWRVQPTVTLSGFYDWGKVSDVQSGPSSQTLKGFGVGLGWAPLQTVNIQGMVAWRHGRNPYPTATGKDQDGSYRNPRFWLQANLQF